MVKRCKACSEEKPLTDFSKVGNKWFLSCCKSCVAKTNRDNRKHRRANDPVYRERENRRTQLATWKRRGIVGMTHERYTEMLKAQQGCCAICGTHRSNTRKDLAVDHDHATGEPRGLLCDRCNISIGAFNDDPELVGRAAHYLRETQPAHVSLESAAMVRCVRDTDDTTETQ